MFEIEKTVKKGAYIYAVVRNHPKATRHGYVLHHRVVMENSLGRVLEDSEIVHHRDENKKNNSLENLVVMSREAHARSHAVRGEAVVLMTCPNCGNKFFKEKRQIHGQRRCFCSRRCNGQYVHKMLHISNQ